MRKSITLLIMIMMLITSMISYHIPVFAEEETDYSGNEEETVSEFLEEKQEEDEEETTLIFEEEDSESEEGGEETDIPEGEEETPAEEELPAEEAEEESEFENKDEADIEEEMAEEIKQDADGLDATGNPNNWPFRVVGSDGSLYLVIGQADDDNWLKDAYRKAGSHIDFIDGNGNVVASYTVENTTRQNKVYLDNFYFYGHNHGLKIDVRKLVDDKLPAGTYKILVHVEGYTDYIAQNVNIKSLASSMTNEKALLLSELCVAAPNDITVTTNSDGDIIINSANKTFLQALAKKKVEYLSYGDTVNGIPERIVYIGGGFISVGGVELQNTGTTILSHDNAKNYHVPDDNPSVLALETVYEYDETNKYVVSPNESMVDNGINDGAYSLTLSAEGYQETTVTATLDLKNPARQLDPSTVTASVNSDGDLVIQCSDPNEGQEYLQNLAKTVNGKITSGGRILANGKYIYNTDSKTQLVLSGNKVTVAAEAIKEAFNDCVSGSTEFTLYSKSFEAITRAVDLPYIISSDGDDGKAAAIEIPKTYIVDTTKTVSWSVYDGNNQLIPESNTSKLTQEKVGNNGLKITAHEIGSYTLKAVTNGVTDIKEIFASAEGLTISAPASITTYLNEPNVKMGVETKLKGTPITVPLEYKVEEGKEYSVEINDEEIISFYETGTVKITANVKGMPELNVTTTFTVYKYNPSKEFSFDLYTSYWVDGEKIEEKYDPDRGMEVGDRYHVVGKIGEGEDPDEIVERWDMTVKSSSTSIASVTGNAVKATKVGNATITVEMTDLNKKKKSSMPVKVVNKIFNEMTVNTYLDGEGIISEEGDVITITVDKGKCSTIELSADGVDRKGQTIYDLTNIKYASNNTAVATVSSKGLITIKDGGFATITATMSDNPSLSKSIVLRIVDPTPKISTNKVTLNKYKEYGEFVEVHAAYQEITGVSVDHVELEKNGVFGCRPLDVDPEMNEIYILDGMSDAAKSGKHTLTVYMSNGDEYSFDLTITVTNKLPSVTVTTGGTYDSFKNEGWLYMSYYSKDYGEWIENVEFGSENGADAGWASFVDPDDKFEVKLKDAAAVKSGIVRFYFYGYTKPVEKKVSFKVTSVKPKVKLSSSSVTIYAPEGMPAEKEVVISLEGTDLDIENDLLSVSGEGNSIQWYDYYGSYATAKLTIRDFTSPIIISYKKPGWSASIDNKLTVKVNSTIPTAKLKTSSVTVYSKYTRWFTDVRMENSEKAEFKEVYLVSDENAFGGDSNAFEYLGLTPDGYVIGKLKNDTIAGTYKVIINAQLKSGVALKPVTLTVKVDEKTDPQVTIKPTTIKFNKNHSETINTVVNYPKNFNQFQLELIGFQVNPVGGTEGEKLISIDQNDYFGYLVSLNEKGKAAAAGKYVHELRPVYHSYETGEDIVVDKVIKLTINISDKAATFKGTMKGNFNPLNTYRTAYATFKYSNVEGTIVDISINEDKCSETIKGKFQIEDYWPGDDVLYVTMLDPDVPDGSYVLPLTLTIDDAEGSSFEGELKVTVKRQAPKVVANPKAIEVFDTTNNCVYTAYLQTTDFYGKIKEASATIDKDTGAYTIEVDNDGFIMVTLVDASKLKTGSTQTAVIKIDWEGDLGPKLKTTTIKLSIKDVSKKIKAK